MTSARPTNPYAAAHANFCEQTQNHHLIVLQDSSLYRHLRVQAPGTRMWSWDITTWPGHLATSGDIADGHMFAREPDMLEFFSNAGRVNYYSDGAPSIDVRYWAEKLCGGRSHEVKKYDPDVFLELVREHLEESEELGTEAQEFHGKQLTLLKRLHELRGLNDDTQAALFEADWTAEERLATTSGTYAVLNQERRDAATAARIALWSVDCVTDEQIDVLIEDHDWDELADIEVPRQSPAEHREEILDDARWHADSESEAHKWLADHEGSVGSDTWEWDLSDFDIHFIFTCYALELTTRRWHEHLEAQTVASSTAHDPEKGTT